MVNAQVAIAGGGIGGLTAALALAQRGVPSIVLEKSTQFDASGAGVQLSPNASRVLIGLGLGDTLGAAATAPSSVVLHSARGGRVLARLPLDRREHDAPYWVIPRAALHMILREAIEREPRVELKLGCSISSLTANADHVGIAVDRAGEAGLHDASVLIGADGVWSKVRSTSFADVSPISAGQVAWRGLAVAPARNEAAPAVSVWLGDNAHVVAYPLAEGARTNLVVIRHEFNEQLPAIRPGAAIADELSNSRWPDAPLKLIAAAEQLTRYPLFTVQSKRLNAGRVALLGDAAHAMLPFVAQGAAMAIEDAAVLADCIADATIPVAGRLARYHTRRHRRVTRVAKAAAQAGRIYHLRGAWADARDLAIRAMGGRMLLARQNWIYDWRP